MLVVAALSKVHVVFPLVESSSCFLCFAPLFLQCSDLLHQLFPFHLFHVSLLAASSRSRAPLECRPQSQCCPQRVSVGFPLFVVVQSFDELDHLNSGMLGRRLEWHKDGLDQAGVTIHLDDVRTKLIL